MSKIERMEYQKFVFNVCKLFYTDVYMYIYAFI